jgi:hypothetical protein
MISVNLKKHKELIGNFVDEHVAVEIYSYLHNTYRFLVYKDDVLIIDKKISSMSQDEFTTLKQGIIAKTILEGDIYHMICPDTIDNIIEDGDYIIRVITNKERQGTV